MKRRGLSRGVAYDFAASVGFACVVYMDGNLPTFDAGNLPLFDAWHYLHLMPEIYLPLMPSSFLTRAKLCWLLNLVSDL